MAKAQRIRDPLHNLIEFDGQQTDQALWRIVQTPQFQRLRRIRQLGFSEFVYPGATHTRFAHSLGVWHIAKKLLKIIQLQAPDKHNEIFRKQALAAALLHDIGHGPFSHAFEEAGKTLALNMVRHEEVSDVIIREKMNTILDEEFGLGFSANVAKLIKSGPSGIYGAVVSSQFDADRLDYMQRDRLMTGTQIGGIDFNWLLTNLETGRIPWGDEDQQRGTRQTFVLGPKAIHAAEAYLLGLFQLYPTVYYHKTTRGAEKLFTQVLIRIFSLVRDGEADKSNLPRNHPLLLFAQQPESLDRALALDDAVILGALPLMADAEDASLGNFAGRLRDRKLFKCVDVRERLKQTISSEEELNIAQDRVRQQVDQWSRDSGMLPILQDTGQRIPYKAFEEEETLNRIMVRSSSGKIVDISEYSPVIKACCPFSFYRLYYDADDVEAANNIDRAIQGASHDR
jgi:HD superfamily phosphohydrolase